MTMPSNQLSAIAFTQSPILPFRRPRAPWIHPHQQPLCTASAPGKSVLVIGGGAAGYFAAITCARHAAHHVSVTILEGSNRVLEKVRISGGGRCNVTSGLSLDDTRAFASNYPRGSREMTAVLTKFGANDVMQFFEDEGVALKMEPGGKIFPQSNSSQTVIDALTSAADRAGVSLCTAVRATAIQRHGDGYVVQTNRNSFEAQYVVIATGSAAAAHKWAAQFGHDIVKTVPSLFTFKINDRRLEGLAGVSVEDCSIALQIPKGDKRRRRMQGLVQRGPVLVTHWGLSGPAVLALSAFGARVLHEERYSMRCVVDWVPSLSHVEKMDVLRSARVAMGGKKVVNVNPFSGKIPRRLWCALVQSVTGMAQCETWNSVSKEMVSELASVLQKCEFVISGKGEFKEEFVTAGGVNLKGVDMKTFESRHVDGLYFAGETLDVDGRTGGFNLEFAWSSGYIAGMAIADSVLSLV